MTRARTPWRLVRHPGATLRMAKALLGGAGPQFGRQVRTLAGEDFTRDLVSSLMVTTDVVEVAFTRDGMVWRSDLGDGVGRELFRSGTYEGDEIAAVLGWLGREGRSGVVVDVGANIGTTTVPFARAGHAVIAIEPVPATYDMLVANVVASGHADVVTTVAVAVAETPGEVEMWVGYGSGRSEVAVDDAPPDGMVARTGASTVAVPAAPLGTVLARRGVAPADVALVWADVQGCETAVITTAAELWPAGVPLWLEVDPVRLERQVGLATFIAAVEERFTAFVPRHVMLVGGAERPISGFADWVRQIPGGRYEDALLVSRPG